MWLLLHHTDLIITDLEKALEDGKENLEKTLENIARLLVLDKAGC